MEDPVIQDMPTGLIAWLYALCGIARLIFFTMDKNPIPGFFKGLPVPAAALLVVAPLMIFQTATIEAQDQARWWGLFCFGLMILASFLMNIYPVHYIHYGRFMNRRPVFVGMNLLLAFISVA